MLTAGLGLTERRGVTLGELRPRPFGLLRIPAFGLKGGVGKTMLPSLRPCRLPYLPPMPCACRGISATRNKSNSQMAVFVVFFLEINARLSLFNLPREAAGLRGRFVGEAFKFEGEY